MAGHLARTGASLAAVKKGAERIAGAVRSLGLSLSSCTIPGQLAEPRGTLFVQLDEMDHVFYASSPRVEAPKEANRLFDGQFRGELRFLKLNAKTLAKLLLVLVPTQSEQLHVA